MTVKPNCKKTRNEVVDFVEKNNIQTRNLFAGNILRHPCFEPLEEGVDYRVVGDLNVTDEIMNNSFWVGVYPGLTEEMMDEMIRVITEAVTE